MNLLVIAQIAVSIILIVVILLQQRGTAIGGFMGGSGETYLARRGIERYLLWATIALMIDFVGLAIANLVF